MAKIQKLKSEEIAGKTLEYSVTHVCNPTKKFTAGDSDFQDTSDRWLFVVEGETFDYYTGIGHRVALPSFEDEFQNLKHRLTDHGFARFLEVSRPVKPSLKDLLYSVFSDTQGIQGASFSEWCIEYGYSDDSISAKGIYEACKINAEKLLRVHDDMDALAEFYEDY